ncbi:DUF1819 family protein [Rhizobium leguminosarum]|uniref:DUF1819 family protein n=1 Tax=Rhizobium leguminosarum TaxID=384 RepID=UPI0010303577|nr:DUF1819 family protein [Rhizobium leguminosarum]TBG63284.1 DUF1819 family protein [Rhizobium leguminosarum]
MSPTGELLAYKRDLSWYGPTKKEERLIAFGFRLTGGGAHQSKTLMHAEIGELLRAGVTEETDFRSKVLGENILGKATSSGRESVLRNLSSLYGLSTVPLLTRVFLKFAKNDSEGQQLLAVLIALSRDPLLRDSAQTVADTAVGMPVQWPSFAARFNALHPGRFSEKMVRSLSQNCASTWTQTGHLEGNKKQRRMVHPSAAAAALAALIATVSGFSGPAILSSGWFRILDLNPDTAMDALRSAEAHGFARVRAAGDVIEISVRQQLATTLGIPELEHV